jgi:hypothetical protein
MHTHRLEICAGLPVGDTCEVTVVGPLVCANGVDAVRVVSLKCVPSGRELHSDNAAAHVTISTAVGVKPVAANNLPWDASASAVLNAAALDNGAGVGECARGGGDGDVGADDVRRSRPRTMVLTGVVGLTVVEQASDPLTVLPPKCAKRIREFVETGESVTHTPSLLGDSYAFRLDNPSARHVVQNQFSNCRQVKTLLAPVKMWVIAN